jgi:hypothetical protein
MLPKANRGPTDQLDELFRRLGKPDPNLLAALLDGVSEQQVRERAEAAPPSPELVTTAIAEIGKAYDLWERLAVEQRRALRGCSLALFGVAADQARQLNQLHAQHLRTVTEHDEARSREQKLMQEAQHVCAQTKGLLLKVVGGRPSIQIALDEKLAESGNAYAMITNLKYLADTSRGLLQLPAQGVRGRATLYGMDKSFIDSLTSLAEEIRKEEEKVSSRPSRLPVRDSMNRVRATLFSVLNHIADVFEGARKIDPTIPLLRGSEPAATSEMMAASRTGNVAPESGHMRKPHALHIPRLR